MIRPHFAGPAERRAVELAIAGYIGWLALRRYPDPWSAARAVREGYARSAAAAEAFGPRKYVRAHGRWFTRFYLPGWPSQTFDAWALNRLNDALPVGPRRPYLGLVFLGLSSRCALRCEHCSAADELTDHEVLPIERHVALVRELQDRGLMQLHLTGGEPLLRFDELLVLLGSMRPTTDTWLNTSGNGLSGPRASALADAGLTGVLVSLDHWDRAVHDRFRGAHGVFDHVVQACRHAADAGLVVALSMCPTRALANREDMLRYLHLARDLGAAFVRVVEPHRSGRWRDQDVELVPAQVRLLSELEIELNGDPRHRELPVLVNYDRVFRQTGCPAAGAQGLYIDSHGQGRSCPFCGTPVGDVFDLGLDEILRRLRAAGCPRHQRAAACAPLGGQPGSATSR